MRDVIARALTWVLSVLAPRRPGRHSAAHFAVQTPEPEPAPVSPWGRPWTGPSSAQVRALGLAEILAVTAAANLRSQAVMRRIGMTRDPADDFDDPGVPDGPLRRSVVYRLHADERLPVGR